MDIFISLPKLYAHGGGIVRGAVVDDNNFQIFIGLLLMLRGLLWVVDGKKGNKRSLSLGLAAIVVGIIMFITVFFETL